MTLITLVPHGTKNDSVDPWNMPNNFQNFLNFHTLINSDRLFNYFIWPVMSGGHPGHMRIVINDMLNNFCFHVYAQNSVFIAKNCNAIFLTSSSSPDPLTFEFISRTLPQFDLSTKPKGPAHS